ncbi:MAG: M28 family metallopeptidase [Acidobacteriia bacterium]|nr:M28 family metallopeptidase [Terriglobia bacterium]
MTGYSRERARDEQRVEEQFRAIPSPEEEKKQHRFFTAEPHPAGSKRNHELALYIADTWKEQGLEDVRIHRYDVLTSLPRSITVEMVAPAAYRASLREDPYDADPDTRNPAIRGGWLSMSASGEVTAPLVYAHSGNPSDYAVLRRNGISVKGKIVLVRYSNPYSYRGFKALTAQREGAAGFLIYSDPAEDGYKRGKVFPDGPWGPESHIQRGAITYDFLIPGDPLTPGWAAVDGAKRISPADAVSVPKIMAVAMSWGDAKHLIERLDGPLAPQSWQGGLPMPYHLGGDGVRVHLKVDMDTSPKPNYVVEARIPGSELPDEWILLGNHRDGWEFGAVDPSSGTASMMELTRALGQMKAQGFRPKRTLIVASWDGEEVGLTGSTEWGEEFAVELKEKLVAYLNVDWSVSGPNFHPSAVGSLAPLLVELSRGITAPSGKSLYEEWRKSAAAARGGAKDPRPVTDDNLVETHIGSGSDFTVFLNYLCRPTVELEFDGPYGVYHSAYDNFFWMNHFGDPGYRYHTLMSQVWGTLALRLAAAEILPFDFAAYGRDIATFASVLVKGNVDLGSLEQRISEFRTAGGELNAATARALAKGRLDASLTVRVNKNIMQVESNWANPDGLPGRPWFKHTLYAARYTYGHLELPGLTEAIEKRNFAQAQRQAEILARALQRNAALLRETRALLP